MKVDEVAQELGVSKSYAYKIVNDKLKGENEVLRSELKDFRFLRKVLGTRQIDNLIAQAKDMEQQRKQNQRTMRRNKSYER